jgi:hypothetical protein
MTGREPFFYRSSDRLAVRSFHFGEFATRRLARLTELTRSHALESKTWNHPVLVGDVLLVRNGEEMGAFRRSLAGR